MRLPGGRGIAPQPDGRLREIERLNRLYSALSRVNQAIVMCPDEDQLLHTVCRVLVECGGFSMASFGWHDEARRTEAERHGIGSMAVLPIRRAGVTCVTLSVYAAERGFFQEKEIALLDEAADLSFGLDNFARRPAGPPGVGARRSRRWRSRYRFPRSPPRRPLGTKSDERDLGNFLHRRGEIPQPALDTRPPCVRLPSEVA